MKKANIYTTISAVILALVLTSGSTASAGGFKGAVKAVVEIASSASTKLKTISGKRRGKRILNESFSGTRLKKFCRFTPIHL